MHQKLKIRWDDEHGRLIAAVIGCIVLLAAAMLLPLAFRKAPEPTEPAAVSTDAEKRAALFTAYWYGGSETVAARTLETPDSGSIAFCEARMAELTERCINDLALSAPGPTGSEYTEITGTSGTLRLCRMWLQAQGDWQNWFDVCFDADSGDIYYFYLSRECLTNRSLYSIPASERPTAESIATELAETLGGRVRYLTATEDGGSAAVITTAEGTLCFEIRSVWYDVLVDIHINMV